MHEVEINKGYELYQIITDFKDPLEIFREAFQNAIDEGANKVFCKIKLNKNLTGEELIIEIWDNGKGLPKDNIHNFFDLAFSTKIDKDLNPQKGKLGYKGHGAKIYFNSRKIEICSKSNNKYFAVELDNPILQIQQNNTFEYSDIKSPNELNMGLPDNWQHGFMIRITGHYHFRGENSKIKLNHIAIRDYVKWFTVFGTILFNNQNGKNLPKLYLCGLDIETFKSAYSSFQEIDPMPKFEEIDSVLYEEIELGHYFPEQRYKETEMRQYSKRIANNKAYYDYYSRMIFDDKVSCQNNMVFYLKMNAEGYETKRRYNILLPKRYKSQADIEYSDTERYGIWACKGGIPVEKIDDWIIGGKGGYTFLHAFIDCDDFNLTANRSSIANTDIEKLDIIKQKLNEIFNSSKVKDLINERVEFEKFESQLQSIEEDTSQLKKRYSAVSKRKTISLSYKDEIFELQEPTKNKSGYSESETLMLLVQIITLFPDLFPFKILDYNTNKGIDFVVEEKSNPKYIELKGSFHNKINHAFRNIYKFICYDLEVKDGDKISDIENFEAFIKTNKTDSFVSSNNNFKKNYCSYKLDPSSASITSMEIIVLKEILTKILNATFM
jgi:hypothetical protein